VSARRPILATVAFAVAVAAGLGGGGISRPVEPGGPLKAAGLATQQPSAGYGQRPGGKLFLGLGEVAGSGAEPITIDRVELQDADPGIDVVGTYVHAGEGGYQIGPWPQRAYRDAVRPAKGYEVPPAGPRRQLLLVVTADAPGDYWARGVAVDYHVGERRYRRVLDVEHLACFADVAKPRCSEEAFLGRR
jgi:hypothetical protein